MHEHTHSRKDMRSHVYLGYMHQIYVNEVFPCSRLHPRKQYVQEARDHLHQGYDAYTYLEDLEHSISRNTLEKTMLGNTRVFYSSK